MCIICLKALIETIPLANPESRSSPVLGWGQVPAKYFKFISCRSWWGFKRWCLRRQLMCVCRVLFSPPNQPLQELWRANEARNVDKTMPECPVLGRHELVLFGSIPLDVILLWKYPLTSPALGFGAHPTAQMATHHQTNKLLLLELFCCLLAREKRDFFTLANPDYRAQGCVFYSWACNSVCSCHKNLQAVLCTKAAAENDALGFFWQKRGPASQDQIASSVMCDFSHLFINGVCWGLLEIYGRLTRSRETQWYSAWCTLRLLTGCLLKSTAVLLKHRETCINYNIFLQGKMTLLFVHPS